jgi:hypothetical protein
MKALALILALCTPLAYADYVAKSGKDSVRLTELPCPVEILKLVPEGTRGYYLAAFVQVNGKAYNACWAVAAQDAVHLMYADGDQGLLPIAHFKNEVGV